MAQLTKVEFSVMVVLDVVAGQGSVNCPWWEEGKNGLGNVSPKISMESSGIDERHWQGMTSCHHEMMNYLFEMHGREL